MKIKLHNIFFVAKSEYLEWLFNPKFCVIVMVLIPLRELVALPILYAAQRMGQPLNFLETSIAATHSEIGTALLVFCYLLLMSSFPSVKGNTYFYLSRMGRRNWVLGELLFQFFSAVTYCLVVIVFMMLHSISLAYPDNGWSLVVTEYDTIYSDEGPYMANLVPASLYYQMTPFKAFWGSYGLTVLFLMLTSVVFTLGCLCGKRLFVFVLEIGIIVLSYVVITPTSKVMWFLPAANGSLSLHYNTYFRKYVFPPGLSVLYFVVLIVLFGVLTYRRAKRVSLEAIGG
jgi:hypothetical protein